MPVTVLVVEDEPAIQELISYKLRNAGHVALCAKSAEQAELMVNNILPDLVLLDWMLPKKSGIEFAKKLRREARTKTLPIIMLTARIEESDKVSALEEIGVDDYITKPFSPRELIARIKAVLRRRLPEISEDIIVMGDITLNPVTHRVTCNGAGKSNSIEVVLGPTEFRLLHFLMTHTERVHTRTQLLDRVWGDHVFVEDRTVDVHIRRLRKALEEVKKDNLVQTVRGIGYRFSVVNQEKAEQN